MKLYLLPFPLSVSSQDEATHTASYWARSHPAVFMKLSILGANFCPALVCDGGACLPNQFPEVWMECLGTKPPQFDRTVLHQRVNHCQTCSRRTVLQVTSVEHVIRGTAVR